MIEKNNYYYHDIGIYVLNIYIDEWILCHHIKRIYCFLEKFRI